MPRTRWIFCAASISALLVFLLLPTRLQAQTEVARTNRDATVSLAAKPNEKPNDIDHRVEALEEQLREQSEKLDKLMALVAEQQRVIAKLTPNDAMNRKLMTNEYVGPANSAPDSRTPRRLATAMNAIRIKQRRTLWSLIQAQLVSCAAEVIAATPAEIETDTVST